jgi:hypothetical protein
MLRRMAKRSLSRDETVPNRGVLWDGGYREFGMKWRVMMELVGADGTVGVHEVSGGAAVAECAPRMIGLTLAEGKHMACTPSGICLLASQGTTSKNVSRSGFGGAQRGGGLGPWSGGRRLPPAIAQLSAFMSTDWRIAEHSPR